MVYNYLRCFANFGFRILHYTKFVGVLLAKTKNKNHDEVRYLKGIVRQLEKENRSLRKEIAYHKKHSYQFEEVEETEEEKLEIQTIRNGVCCEECGKGILVEFEILNKIFGTCNICGHRKKLK